MEVKASTRYLRIAPRKARLVAGLIKGMPAERALLELRHLPKRASLPIEKLLRSALANAKHNFGLDGGRLFVKQAVVDGGPVLKRSMPRAFGRAALIRKRTSHIMLTLDEMGESTAKARKPGKGAPAVRKATLEELSAIEREEAKGVDRDSRGQGSGKAKGGGRGFTSRIFNRKAV